MNMRISPPSTYISTKSVCTSTIVSLDRPNTHIQINQIFVEFCYQLCPNVFFLLQLMMGSDPKKSIDFEFSIMRQTQTVLSHTMCLATRQKQFYIWKLQSIAIKPKMNWILKSLVTIIPMAKNERHCSTGFAIFRIKSQFQNKMNKWTWKILALWALNRMNNKLRMLSMQIGLLLRYHLPSVIDNHFYLCYIWPMYSYETKI